MMTKKTYRLTIIEEREEVPSRPSGFFAGSRWLLVRIGLAITAWFHGGQ